MPPKKHIIIIGVLCVISLGLGYWYGLPKEEGSGQMNAGNPEDKEETTAKEPEFLKQGLVAYYPFNGNAKDESGNQLHGTVQEGQLYPDKNGKPDSSYEFKGNGKIILPESQKFELQKMTLSAWVNIDEEKLVGDQVRFLIDKRNKGESVQHYALMYSPSEAFTIYSKNPSTGANTYHSTPYGDSRPKRNQWAMVTGTYDGLNRKLYVDGQLVDHRTEKVSVLNQRPFDITIGSALLDRQAAGWRIDEVRIYDRALSEAQVKELYEFEKPKTQQASTAKPPRQLTLEEKKVVGVYTRKNRAGGTYKRVFLDNGVIEFYDNGKKLGEDGKWEVVDGELRFDVYGTTIFHRAVCRINNDGSFTTGLAEIKDGKRTTLVGRGFTYKKIK